MAEERVLPTSSDGNFNLNFSAGHAYSLRRISKAEA